VVVVREGLYDEVLNLHIILRGLCKTVFSRKPKGLSRMPFGYTESPSRFACSIAIFRSWCDCRDTVCVIRFAFVLFGGVLLSWRLCVTIRCRRGFLGTS
jgi:hypothetical protein